MSVLDELRDAIDAHVGAASGDRKHTWMDAIRLLDAFEAAHPGLVDRTRLCRNCHAPIVTAYMTWQAFDPATTWLCPACAKASP